MSRRGFTVLEVSITALLLVVILTSVAAGVADSGTRTARVLLGHIGPELRATQVLDRMAAELRMAAVWGEDLDHDGELDPGEDSNDNKTFDADWNLADGAVGQDNLTFNRRIDEYDIDGRLLASGIFSRAITYRLEGTDLVREWRFTDAKGGVETRRAVLASRVAAVRFSRKASIVEVEIDMVLPDDLSDLKRTTLATKVWLRN